MSLIVDSHCHLDYDGLYEHLPEVLARAEDSGVGLVLSISSRIRGFEKILGIAETYENVFCTVGTHPHNAHEELDIPVSEMVALAQHLRVVGIGAVSYTHLRAHETM
jgi:TatD DNase family protein